MPVQVVESRPEIVDAFVAAVVRVMRISLNEEARMVATRYAPDVDPPPSIIVSIELRGTLRGPVTWSFSPTLARQVAESMLLGAAAEEHYADAVAELANMVLGNAAADLEQAGYLVELAPPSIRRAGDAGRAGEHRLVVDVATASGQMQVLFDVEEAA
jgi:CheY-specific phosphatase CheX